MCCFLFLTDSDNNLLQTRQQMKKKVRVPVFKMRAASSTALTHAPLGEQSQLGAAADYFLIK